ncbi:probable inactive receptor kinase At4g23740 [Prosopis cineraria]|uniref:probable inactive receptor kinase At4g23740 n=1 Tax=Prosopis cineraria TaxID=364024 RepID=UPI00240FA0A1|nr:probable inactive receptor kinase At4g23740 [Prosopis cineraria]XP_054799685.1 probable inactive receptor kinase At4g23740 [Prosopis cineraria]XP_054799686.1 probable inactive receptor kinase At4g23740 [Prosopis cineraria]
MGKKTSLLITLSAAFITGAIFVSVGAEPVEDKKALLDFYRNIGHSHPLNWDENSSACKSWRGVFCNSKQSRVVALHLPGAGLSGPFPSNTLGRLSELHTLSLRSNRITGPFPSDFSELKNLSYVYLQFNKFSGPLPSDFSGWNNLIVINLCNNSFTGSIPSSISKLTHLTYLVLANNSLSGEIPDLDIPSLKELNLANNHLSGVVPKSLERFPGSAFAGNDNLTTENAIPPAMPLQPPNAPPRMKTKLSEPALLAIIIGGCVLLFLVIAAFLLIRSYQKGDEDLPPVKSKKKEESLKKEASETESQDKNKIVFFEGRNLAFDLEDLLRSSAEVLGKGTFGTTYKAALDDVTTVVVKRLKEVVVGKREFEQQMEVVGRIRHDNVVPLRAYYYSKEEKLMVYDHFEQGSVSAMLHGRKGEGRASLDWDSRLRIAIGAARGMAHIHTQHGGKLVHGNLKASNVFLNSQGYGCVSDAGLATLTSSMALPAQRTGGYRAPEVTDMRKASHAADIYSFGVLVLELLTGKSPIHATGSEEAVHLVRWVNSVVREEWTAEVFDVELLRYSNIEEEMVDMLQIGMACAVRVPERRPKVQHVVRMLEEVRKVNTGTQSSTEASTPTPQAIIDVPSSSSVRQ